MTGLVGVSLRTAGHVHYYETGGLELSPGDAVVVETLRGLELGEVVPAPADLPAEAVGKPARRVTRPADDADHDLHFRNRLRAAEALRRGRLVDPQYVQSTEQEEFLQRYEDAILRKII